MMADWSEAKEPAIVDGCFPMEFWAEYRSGHRLVRVCVDEMDGSILFYRTYYGCVPVGVVENGTRFKGIPVNGDGVASGVCVPVISAQVSCADHMR